MEVNESTFVFDKFSPEEEIPERFSFPETVSSKIKIKICFSPELEKAFNILRFLIKSHELSARSQMLTKFVIGKTSSHYAAWIQRKQYLQKLNNIEEYRAEEKWCLSLIRDEPKVFQTWDHLRFCVDKIGHADYQEQVHFLEKIYKLDTKNYHAWSYRVWLTKRFNFHELEMRFVIELLIQDPNNNSIWSYRHFLVQNSSIFLEEENFIYSWLSKDFKNESAWLYLDDLYEKKKEYSEKLNQFLELLKTENKTNRFVLKSNLFNEIRREKKNQQKKKMMEIASDLANIYDIDRSAFWKGFCVIFIDN